MEQLLKANHPNISLSVPVNKSLPFVTKPVIVHDKIISIEEKN